MIHRSDIDPQDLRPMKASEIELGGIFYRKDPEGYRTVCIHPDEAKGRPVELRAWTTQFSKEGRLFVRINRPFSSFV